MARVPVPHTHRELSSLQLFDHLAHQHDIMPAPLSASQRNRALHVKLHQPPSVPRTHRTGKWLIHVGLTLLAVGGTLFALLFLLALANALWGWA